MELGGTMSNEPCTHERYIIIRQRLRIVSAAWCPACGAFYGYCWGHGPKWWDSGSHPILRMSEEDYGSSCKALPTIDADDGPVCRCEGCRMRERDA